MSVKATSSRHIPALDGLRGIAILLVLVWHIAPPLQSFFPGWSGVDLFFVISGYLITGRLLATKGRPHYLSGFFRNRALRILPLYYAVVIGFLFAVHLFVQQKNLPEFSFYTQHWKSYLLFLQNWPLVFSGLPPNPSLVHLWSLAIEEQFYLVWPLAILLIPSSRASFRIFTGLVIVIITARTICYLSYPSSHQANYFNTFFRIDSLIIGALLCQLHAAGVKIPVKIARILALALLALIIAGNVLVKSVDLASPFNGTVGYILHYPIIHTIGTKIVYWGLTRWPGHDNLAMTLSMTVCLLLSFALATFSFRYFESFFLRLKSHPAPSEPGQPGPAIS